MALQYIDQADIQGKRILARFDFNVPLDGATITDSSRIDMALPTIKYILDKGVSQLILISHLGRPKGKPEAKYSLEPVAKYLAEQLKEDVLLTESALDEGIRTLQQLKKNKIILLENIRFHSEEEQNDFEFAKKIASYADLYVNDAFGVSHREHASVHALVAFFKDKSYAGFLIKKELEALQKITENPKKPFMALVGGLKVSDKIKTLDRLLVSVDKLLIGGAMAYPFLKAQGIKIGASLCSPQDVALAQQILSRDKGNKIVLPTDHVAAKNLEGEAQFVSNQALPENLMGLDIGEKTIKNYTEILSQAKTIFWNGPMGLFENPLFAKGTLAMARALADNQGAFSLVGGGDSVSALNKSGLADKISHVSSGGGASLEFIEKGSLPGISALRFGVSLP